MEMITQFAMNNFWMFGVYIRHCALQRRSLFLSREKEYNRVVLCGTARTENCSQHIYVCIFEEFVFLLRIVRGKKKER